MTKLTRVVAAVVDTTKATLYKADGNTVEILQGDARLRPILEHITPLLTSQGWAEIDLSSINSWKEFEEKSTGGFRFFKIAKDKIRDFFGVVPVVHPTAIFGDSLLPNVMSALDQILKHATPVTDPEFNDHTIAPQRPVVDQEGSTPNDRVNEGKEEYFDKHVDTIVAVGPTGQIVPGVERIKSQFTAAAKHGNTKGLEVFMIRLSKVIEHRQHSANDLLRFMERGDLPVADDGCIVAFKKLYKESDAEHGEYFVDPHTRKVRQKIGSYVYMDADQVDPNRRNECSNGLHVGRRGYMGSFSGNAICIVKIRPEDVIAVPEYDANKMRVCGYHVIQQLTNAQYQAVNGNRPVSNAEGGAELLANVIAGNHVPVLENVKIGSANGGDLQITSVGTPAKSPVAANKRARKLKKKIKKKAKKLKPVKALDAHVVNSDKAVDIKAVVARQNDASRSLMDDAPAPLLGPKDEAQALWTKALGGSKSAAQQLLDLKKAKKKGWAVWDLDPSAGDTLKGIING